MKYERKNKDDAGLQFGITVWNDVTGTKKSEGSSTFDELIKLIETPSATEKKKLPLLKLAAFGNVLSDKGSLRHDGNVTKVYGIEIDYDGSKVFPPESRVTLNEACKRVEKAGAMALLYTTPSNTPDAPHWRVLAPFAEVIIGTTEEMHAQRADLVKRLDKALGGVAFPESLTLSQSFFFGGVRGGPPVEILRTEGRCIDELPELDSIKIEPPHTPPKQGNKKEPGNENAADDTELVRRIMKGDGRHNSLLTLTARYVARGVAATGIVTAIRGMLDASDLPRDAKFKKRYAEVPKLVESATKKFAPPADTTKRPVVEVRTGRITEAQDAVAGILAKTGADLGLYVNGSRLVRPCNMLREGFADIDGNREQVEALEMIPRTLATFQSAINRGVAFKRWKRDKGKEPYAIDTDCPQEIARALFEDPDAWRNWPRIERVAEVPLFDGKSLHAGPGLVGSTWVKAPEGVTLAKKLNKAAAIEALGHLRSYLAEFPFATANDEATALALILTAGLRPSLGAAPGFLIDKTDYGSGATTLGRIAGVVATGRAPPVLTVSKSEEEFEKMLGAALMQGRHVIALDNVPEKIALRGTLLTQMMTEPQCEPRVLGESRNVVCDTTRLVFATGVNLSVVDDLVRRFLTARLDPKLENPSERKFKRPDIVEEMRQERSRILSAIFTIVASYLHDAKQVKTTALAGFPQFIHWVAEPLLWLGLPDIIQTARATKAANPEDVLLRRILALWTWLQGSRGMTVHDLMHGEGGDGAMQAQRRKELKGLLGEATNAREIGGVPELVTRAVGKWIAEKRGRIRGNLRFEREEKETRNGMMWRVIDRDDKVQHDVDAE
jgi:hypothetical protein